MRDAFGAVSGLDPPLLYAYDRLCHEGLATLTEESEKR